MNVYNLHVERHNKNNDINNSSPLQKHLIKPLISLGYPLYSLIEKMVLGFFYLISTFFSLFNKTSSNSKSKNTTKKTNKFILIGAWILFFVCTTPLIIAALIWSLYLQDLPSPQDLVKRDVEASTKLYDKNGFLLFNVYDAKNRTPLSLSEIPIHVRQATLAIEDAEFYQHPGFSLRGIVRAALDNYQNEGQLSGGSTITQQLVKNTLLSSEKTIERKIRELVLSFMVEWTFSKDEILEMYLNEVSYGGTAYGIQEASRQYFNKDVQGLTLAEAAFLAGLPKSPTTYSPYGNNPQAAYGRQKTVLRLMEINGYITKKEREQASSSLLWLAPNTINIQAPHFVMYIRELLENEYSPQLITTGGLRVLTTLDLVLQEKIQKIVTDEVNKLSPLNVGNGAAVILDTKTGNILALVGSKDYFDQEAGGNVNMAIRPRQPGSSIKTINYTYALSHGWTAASILEDTPYTILDINSNTPYTPKNYDGSYKGNLTLRNAFAQSRNIPAVRLLNEYGVDTMIAAGREMGITTWNDPRGYGLSLTLGGGEVKLTELASAYSVLANGGKKTGLHAFEKVVRTDGKVMYENPCTSSKDESACATPLIDPRVAFIVTDILSDNNARTPAFGANSELVIPGHPEVAVKTGTSNDLRDNLTVGYTKDYVVAVWVGNNDFSPMSRIASGLTGASTIFNRIMTELLKEKETYEWEKPNGLVERQICTSTGTLSCSGCPTITEYFLEENAPVTRCNSEQFVKNEDADTTTAENQEN